MRRVPRIRSISIETQLEFAVKFIETRERSRKIE